MKHPGFDQVGLKLKKKICILSELKCLTKLISKKKQKSCDLDEDIFDPVSSNNRLITEFMKPKDNDSLACNQDLDHQWEAASNPIIESEEDILSLKSG